MVKDESAIEHCQRCIAEEETFGDQAPTREAGERHYQLAMLYRAQLRVLERQRRRMRLDVAGHHFEDCGATENTRVAL